jgi:hypothetical protein
MINTITNGNRHEPVLWQTSKNKTIEWKTSKNKTIEWKSMFWLGTEKNIDKLNWLLGWKSDFIFIFVSFEKWMVLNKSIFYVNLKISKEIFTLFKFKRKQKTVVLFYLFSFAINSRHNSINLSFVFLQPALTRQKTTLDGKVEE